MSTIDELPAINRALDTVQTADQARAATVWLVQNPLWPLGGLVLFALLRPGRVLRWSGLALQGWAAYRRVQRLMDTIPTDARLQRGERLRRREVARRSVSGVRPPHPRPLSP